MNRRNRAFTLLELLVVIAIIALLVGLVAVSLRTVRASATRSKSLGALRQMMLGYKQYADEHRGHLMPGYIGDNLFNLNQPFVDLVVRLPGGAELDPLDSQSYVWRLAPYLDNAWETFFTDMSDPGSLNRFHQDFGAQIYGPADPAAAYLFGISERPSYGLNSIFVGGDSVHGGTDITDRNPWTGTRPKIAATRLSEVKNPSRLIVFAPTGLVNTLEPDEVYEDPVVGFCELRPPYLEIEPSGQAWGPPQWWAGERGLVEKTPEGEYAEGAGLPIDRSGKDMLPVVHLDGSAVVEQFSKLSRDMRRWSPFEVGPRPTSAP
jgi:prepilin-type N-terminal cleavage/methylation domain-containing protein